MYALAQISMAATEETSATAQQSAAKTQATPSRPTVIIVVAPSDQMAIYSPKTRWTKLPNQPSGLDLLDIAMAPDESFGVAVGRNGTVIQFDAKGIVAIPKLQFAETISSVHIGSDGSVWAASPLDDNGRRTVLFSSDRGSNWKVLDQRHSPAPWTTYLALPMLLFSLGGGARALILRRIADTSGTRYVADIPSNDRPIGLRDHDSLNFRPIARAAELFIRNINTEPPITMAITGGWGSGKSSLMNLIKEMLEQGGARPVWFNAWHHQNEESLLAALLENIRQQAIPRFWTWSGLSFRTRLLQRRLIRELRWIIALIVFSGALVFLLAVSGYRSLSDISAANEWIKSLGNLNLLAAPIVLAVPILGYRLLSLLKVFPDSAAATLKAVRRPRAGDIRDKLAFRYRFAQEFEESADVLRTPFNPGLVIFLDDLDRCRPENVVEILEALNFVSSAGKCIILLGMSKKMVSRAIWRAHEDMFKDEWGIASDSLTEAQRAEQQQKHRAFSESYLEKLINIELALPVPTPEQSQSLLGPAPRPPRWLGLANQIRRAMDWIYELGPSLVAACLILLTLYFTPPPPPVAQLAAPSAETSKTTVAALPSPSGSETSQAPAPATSSQIAAVNFASTAELATKYSDHSWAAEISIATVFVLLLITFAVRYLVLASRPKVSDTPEFDTALQLWAPVVRMGNPTPRYLKRYKNRVRYFAMRMRSVPEQQQAADRIARWIFGRFRGTETGAVPPASGTEPDVKEANIVALTALRTVDPRLGSTNQESLMEQIGILLFRCMTTPSPANGRKSKRL
jgi:hypothetical protein